MKKFKLALEDLSVESFAVSGGSPGKGTVHGREALTELPCNSVDACNSYDGGCGGTELYSCAGDCLESFNSDCETCAGFSCEGTCHGSSCLRPTICPTARNCYA